MSVAVDVRVRRTQERLRAAVVRLASSRPVEEIPVADLVRAARINRTTFYKHAASPAEVLQQVLYEDLDRMRAHWLGAVRTAPAQEIWDRSSGELADHLDRFDGLYAAGLVGGRSAVLHRLLVDHFVGSVRGLLDRVPSALPEGEGTREWRAAAYSAFVAHGQVGVVEAWFAHPAPRDRTLLISASAAMLPGWLTGPLRPVS